MTPVPSQPQAAELARVSVRISAAIVRFMRTAGQFHADDLRAYVESEVGACAPGSADRIMRDLRQKQVINYVLLSRRGSLYKSLPLVEQHPDPEPTFTTATQLDLLAGGVA